MTNSSRQMCCQMLLAKKDIKISLPHEGSITLQANNFILILTEDSLLNCTHLHDVQSIRFSYQFIKDYIGFIQKNPDYYHSGDYIGPSYLVTHCEYMDIFMDVAIHAKNKVSTDVNYERNRWLLFSSLSLFLKNDQFIPFLMQAIQKMTTLQVYSIIKKDVAHPWRLVQIAKQLCISTSLLKKRLNKEGSSYGAIIADCRMSYALEQLLKIGGPISDVSALCGYKSTAYFIMAFKKRYGTTPLKYVQNNTWARSA
ncbi:helix-turn-helix domain-containing protein (plasmid) [Edwardsiella tarda]|uniref:helix-turn-helix domain-containing protein n=1 Tax=Edwardsiella tarda TaxID=636 RepID=UPI002443B9EA|nr:helix-turn-helix domain-containing protein [Edwardsiella tarda]WGE31003.1 helix-turn-helix domain-containing protein [Edwardsiella tarda]WGE31078.1 helix-turn-helix domain-containing protein [Edwardsiella tarda]